MFVIHSVFASFACHVLALMTVCVNEKRRKRERERKKATYLQPVIDQSDNSDKEFVFVIFGIFMRRIKLFLSQSIHVEDIFKPGPDPVSKNE